MIKNSLPWVTNKFVVFLYIWLVLTTLHCANQALPSGGPIDTEPPYIVATYPNANELNYKSNKFSFEFNKYIERKSFEDAVFVSPANIIKPDFDWSGKKVNVILPYELDENKTYSITIGTDVLDVNNKNRMAQAYTLAFSTGNHIDTFFMAGKVFDDLATGYIVVAYKINDLNQDTLNPCMVYSDYTTQTGKNGEFILKNLSEGKYRIFAIRDEYKNLLYDQGIDKIGSYWEDITLDSNNMAIYNLFIKTHLEDTAFFKLLDVDAIDMNHISIRLNRNIDVSSWIQSSVTILDSTNEKNINIINYYIEESKPNRIKLLTSEMTSNTYIITVNSIKDSLGNVIDSNSNTYSFVGSIENDTLKPAITTISLSDSMTNYVPIDPIKISINNIIDTNHFKNSILLMSDSNNILFDISFYNNSYIIISSNHFLYNKWYKLIIPKNALISHNSLYNQDSIIINFKTEERPSVTAISGLVESEELYIIEATNDKNLKYKTKMKENKSFKLENIKEGKYTLFLFNDADSNSVYTNCKINPYKKPEKFYYLPDTLKVKASWPLEDVIIKMP